MYHSSIIVFVLFGCLLFNSALCFAQLTWSVRQVELNASVADQEVQASYAFANNTDHPITIKEINTSCGCAKIDLEKKTYAPGEEGTLSDRSPVS